MKNHDITKILLTGGGGWLGQAVLRALIYGLPDCESLSEPSQNIKIRCLVTSEEDRIKISNISPNIETVIGDLRNQKDCETFVEDANESVVIHLAGVIHPKKVKDFFSINVRGSQNLLEASHKAGIKKAVVMSSNSPCGTNPHPIHLFDENSPYHPYMNYGKSKMLMEKIVHSFQKNGMQTVVIRAPWFYGPLQPPRQTTFFKMIHQGKFPIVGDGKNLRSMAYIDNLAQGILLATFSEKANGQTYWIADEKPYSMNEIVRTVSDLLSKELETPSNSRTIRLSSFVSDIAYAMDWLLQSVGLYHQKIHVLSEMNKSIACSVNKAKKELNYSPKIYLEEGMRRSIRWCIQQGLL